MPSLVATTYALSRKPCVSTHYVCTNNAKFSGHYVCPRTETVREHVLRSHQFENKSYRSNIIICVRCFYLLLSISARSSQCWASKAEDKHQDKRGGHGLWSIWYNGRTALPWVEEGFISHFWCSGVLLCETQLVYWVLTNTWLLRSGSKNNYVHDNEEEIANRLMAVDRVWTVVYLLNEPPENNWEHLTLFIKVYLWCQLTFLLAGSILSKSI